MLDTDFGTCGIVTTPVAAGGGDFGEDTIVRPDDAILVAGYNYGEYLVVALYTDQGVLDSGFGTDGIVTTAIGDYQAYGHTLLLLPDGKFIVAGSWYNLDWSSPDFVMARYTATGDLDTSFGIDGIAKTATGSGNDSILDLARCFPTGRSWPRATPAAAWRS